MEARLTFRYDREGDILSIDICPPYPGQETEELGDDVVARLNPTSGEIESLEVMFLSSRLLAGGEFGIPVKAKMRPVGSESLPGLVDEKTGGIGGVIDEQDPATRDS